MGTIWADGAGVILRAQRDTENWGAPDAFVGTLVFDDTTNVGLADDICQHTALYAYLNGVLTKNGATVTIAAAAPQPLDAPISALSTARTQYAQDQAAVSAARTAITSATATLSTADAQVQAATTQAQALAAMKALSTAVGGYASANNQALLAILGCLVDIAAALQSLADTQTALKARFDG